MISVLQQLADEAFEDEYLKELLHKLEENFCSNFYKSPHIICSVISSTHCC